MRKVIFKVFSGIGENVAKNIKNNSIPLLLQRSVCTSSSVEMAAPVGAGVLKGKKGPTLEKFKLPVETDPVKLVNYVCGADIHVENPQDPAIKPDFEYPDWLWELRLSRPPPLDELDPNSKEYWIRTFAHLGRYHKKLKSLRRF